MTTARSNSSAPNAATKLKNGDSTGSSLKLFKVC